MMSTRRFFYDDPEPSWVIDTAASQMIRFPMSYAAMPNIAPSPMQLNDHAVVNREQARQTPLARGQTPILEYRTLEFRVPLCCEGCQDRVVKHMRKVRGVDDVHCDLHRQKVTIKGYGSPTDVLMGLKKLFKRSEFWVREPVMVVRGEKGKGSQLGAGSMQRNSSPIQGRNSQFGMGSMQRNTSPTQGRNSQFGMGSMQRNTSPTQGRNVQFSTGSVHRSSSPVSWY